MFLQTIQKHDTDEITRRVYEAQKDDPVKGDFVELVKEDAKTIDYSIDETHIRSISKYQYQKEIKNKVKIAAFKYLQQLQQSHSKIRDIKYHNIKMQSYMCAPDMSSEDIALLFALRTRTVRGIRSDFGEMFSSDQCPLCIENPHKDTLKELIKCPSLAQIQSDGTEYEQIFSTSVEVQKKAMKQFRALLTERDIQLTMQEITNSI